MGVMKPVLTGLGVLVGLGIGTLLLNGDFASDDPGFEIAPGNFQGRFIAVSDVDMAGTAYADGKLEPLPGAIDQAILFEDGVPVADVPAPNSVISWPQIVDVSSDGQLMAVVETFGDLGQSVEAVDDAYAAFPAGNTVRLYQIDDTALSEIDSVQVGAKPQSVEFSPNDNFLVIGTEEDGAELSIVTVTETGLGGVQTFGLAPPYEDGDAEKRVRVVHLSPDGAMLAANVGNVRVQFYSIEYGADGLPVGVTKRGAAIDVGVRLAVGRWSLDGGHFLITDVNSYSAVWRMLTQRGGQVHSIKPPSSAADPVLIDSVRVGRFAEGLEFSDDGTRIASIAMERTYLPELPFLEFWPKRRQYTLALLSFDPSTGEMEKLSEIQAAGVLPEDVVFDETGQNLAVATFHRRKGEDRQRGFIDFFSIEDDRLVAQNRTQIVPRGPHDLVRLPSRPAN